MSVCLFYIGAVLLIFAVGATLADLIDLFFW